MESIISSHIFLFSFTINAPESEQSFMSDIEKVLEKSEWQKKTYKPGTKGKTYSEYFYFHPFARSAIFDTCNDKSDQPLMNTYSRKLDDNATFKLHIKNNEAPNLLYLLRIKNISLRIFETQIGIMSFELLNEKYQEIDDIIKINDYGRRIYPQFIVDGNIDATKNAFLADKIEFIIDDEKFSEEIFLEKDFKKNHIVVAKHIQKLLGEDFSTNPDDKDKYRFNPTIDDRMYVVCWFGSDKYANKLTQKESDPGKPIQEYSYYYEHSPLWYRFIFHDGNSVSCTHEGMLAKQLKSSTYERWVGYNTLYGISRYGLVCISEGNSFVQSHMRQHYAYMAMILLAQRASILRFSEKVSHISSEIKRLEPDQKNNEREQRKVALNVSSIHAAYIRFVNRLWFTEITPQEQGIEMYEKAVKTMRLKDDMSDLRNEIKELYEFTSNFIEKQTSQKMNTLTILGAIFLPIMMLTGFFGMNLQFVDIGIFKPLFQYTSWLEKENLWIQSIVSFIIFIISFFLLYRLSSGYIKDIKKDDSNIYDYLKLRYLFFRWVKKKKEKKY